MDKNYKQLIKESGLKQKWIADTMGMSETTMSHKLTGKIKFTKAEKYMLDAILKGEKVD